MEITVSLNFGPLTAEFQGEDRGEIEDELIKLVQFLEENDESLNEIGISPGRSYTERPSKVDSTNSISSESLPDNGFSEPDEREGSPLYPIARRIGTTVTDLEEFLYVDEDLNERPQILIDDNDRLGDTVPERQRNAALILLLLWKECYGNDTMKTSEIKDLFAMADISSSKTNRAWSGGERWLEASGKGRGATVKLRGPGEREAYKLLQDLLESDPE